MMSTELRLERTYVLRVGCQQVGKEHAVPANRVLDLATLPALSQKPHGADLICEDA
jgi:hypothetical protein